MAIEHHRFLHQMSALLSSDNSLRGLAESSLSGIPVEQRVKYLLGTVRNSGIDDKEREVAAILLMRVFSKEFDDLYEKVTPEDRVELKNELLSALKDEAHRGVRLKICQAVTEFARQLVDDKRNGRWPEFLEFILDSLSHGSSELKETALLMFGSVPGIFGNRQSQHLIVIKQMLQQCFRNSHYPVRYQAAKSLSSFILVNNDAKIEEYFSDLTTGIIRIVAESIERQDDVNLLKSVVELAGDSALFVPAHIEELVQLCSKTVSNETLIDSWRHLALEVIVTLAEKVPYHVRKTCSTYLPLVISTCFKMMTALRDDDQWSKRYEPVQEDSSSDACIAELALDRLARGIGGASVLPHVLLSLTTMFQHQDWKHRHAALMAVSTVGGGCRKQMECHLTQIADICLKLLSDVHPRVRYAACQAIGQMASDFSPVFQQKFHDKVIHALLDLMVEDSAHPRVQAHAGAALVNFSEDCPKAVISRHLDTIAAKLEIIVSVKFNELLENGSKLVLEQAVTTLASIANSSEEKFSPYYDRFMPRLKCINIQSASIPGLGALRGRTVECVAIIGLAVGAERFTQDASQVMDMLLKRQTNCETTHEDPEQLPYLISAWAKICKILGKAFRPYLPLVMEPVLRAARVKPEVFLVKSGHVKSNQSHGAWQYISLNAKQNFGINTSQFEDKANACQMLVCYARELKEAFCDYTEQVVRLMVPLLTFYFHDGVRIAAVESLPYLIECAKGRGAQHVQGLWSYMCPNVLKAIGNEPEKDVLAELLASLAKCIEQLGGACLTDELLNELMKTLGRLLTSHLDSADERRRKLEGDDCDEIVREQLVDSDEEDARIMSKIIQVIHALLVGYRSFFIPTFDCLIPHVMRLLGADRSWQDQRWAVCIFNELIEFTGEASVKYHEIFIKPLYDFLEHESLELRQAAAYGWGVLAMHGTGVYSIACHQAVPGLIEIITAPGSRCEANACVTESAISAVTKILKYSSSYVVVNEILPLWITWLPVWNDGNEAICVYEYLCDLVEGRHPVVLGPNHVKVPPIVSVIAEAFYKDVPKRDSPVYRRMLNIVSWVQRDLGALEACLAALAPYHREALQRALIG